MTTAGTNQAETASASRWIGARLRLASLTMWTICANNVSEPMRCDSMISEPVPLTVAPMTRIPAVFSTGIDSPVIIDSSTDELPSTTMPSTGTFSPARIRKWSPIFTSASGMSSSVPSTCTLRAVFGAT